MKKRGFKTGSCFSCFGGKIYNPKKGDLKLVHALASYEQIWPRPRILPPFFHTQFPLSAWAMPFSLFLFLCTELAHWLVQCTVWRRDNPLKCKLTQQVIIIVIVFNFSEVWSWLVVLVDPGGAQARSSFFPLLLPACFYLQLWSPKSSCFVGFSCIYVG